MIGYRFAAYIESEHIYFQVDTGEFQGTGSQTLSFLCLECALDDSQAKIKKVESYLFLIFFLRNNPIRLVLTFRLNLDKYKPFFYLTFDIDPSDRKPCIITVLK